MLQNVNITSATMQRKGCNCDLKCCLGVEVSVTVLIE